MGMRCTSIIISGACQRLGVNLTKVHLILVEKLTNAVKSALRKENYGCMKKCHSREAGTLCPQTGQARAGLLWKHMYLKVAPY